jgi:signal transduction histidine kinase
MQAAIQQTEGNIRAARYALGLLTILLLGTGAIFLTGLIRDFRRTQSLASTLQGAVDERDRVVARSAQLSAVGEMTGELAHEIRTPLSIIQGRARQLLRTPASQIEKHNALIGNILSETDRISKILAGLMDLLREGQARETVGVDLREIVESVTQLCVDKFKNRGVQLTVTGDSCRVSGRPVQLAQVFLNLLNNAFDAITEPSNADAGDKWISIEWRAESENSIIRVRNGGPKIPEEIRQKIF